MKRMMLAAAMGLLGACDATQDEAVDAPRLIAAAVDGCAPSWFFDSGAVVYVTVPATCRDDDGLSAVLAWGTANTVTSHRLAFTRHGEARPVTFEGEHRRKVSVHPRGKWRAIENQSWRWRDGAGLLVKDGGLYLVGGWNGDHPLPSEVWFTEDLHDWRLLTQSAPWGPRHGAGWLVHRGRLYVLGGDLYPDAWSSSDGVDWRLESSPAPFGKRYGPSAVSDGEHIFLYGGQYWEPFDWCAFLPECVTVGLNDVWSSAEGKHWTPLVNAAPWGGRALVHGGAYFRGRIYVIGGGLKAGLVGATFAETVAEFSDIWSSADGVEWRLESEELGFLPRTHFALTSTPHGCYAANGSVGEQRDVSSEVFFASDCVHFAAIPEGSTMGMRHGSSLAYFNGSIVVLGGHIDTAGTAIWQYFPDFPD